MKRLIGSAMVVIACLALAGASHQDDTIARGFVFDEVESQGRDYPYCVYVPREHDVSGPWPLVIFLHGRGECGTDGQRQLGVGLAPRVVWNPERYPAVILFPQKPTFESQWEDHSEAVAAMIERTKVAYSIDENRVYLTGLSQGGHGTWMINAAMPGVFAAIAPVCGYAQHRGAGNTPGKWTPDPKHDVFKRIVDGAKDIPTWAFHGDADTVVPASHTKALVGALKEQGADARMTLYPDVGHGCWDQAYGDEAFSLWLFEQRRE